MTGRAYRRYWLPALLAALALLLLARVLILSRSILIPEDLDVVVLVALLSAGMIAAIHALVRISMRYLRVLSVQRARRETLAEHGRFLRRLDHELKNPLTALRAGIRTLSLTELDSQQQQIVNTMEVETVRLSRLVADLRKLAELEAQPLNLQPMHIDSFVANVLQMERDRFEEGGRILITKVETKHNNWIVDEDLLSLAVHNLLDNAYKYTRPGDTIRFRVIASQDLFIEISDTGIGIPPAALDQVWEELYRAEQLEKMAGSGIGLALVKTIIERHEGAVGIESEPGDGTTVSLWLPALPQS